VVVLVDGPVLVVVGVEVLLVPVLVLVLVVGPVVEVLLVLDVELVVVGHEEIGFVHEELTVQT